LFLKLVHLFKHFEISFFLSCDDGVASFKFRLSNFQVFIIIFSYEARFRVGLSRKSIIRLASFVDLALDNEFSVLLSLVLFSQKLFFKSLYSFGTIIFLASSLDSFSNNFIEDLLFSRLSLGQFVFKFFLFLKSFSLAVKLSNVNILKDTVVFGNKFVFLLSFHTFNSHIWIRHNQLFVLLS